MGQLLKILIVSVAISVILVAVRKMLIGRPRHSERTEERNAVQSMTKCAHCGTYLPEPQALFDEGKPYCNEEHRRIASKK